MHVGQFLHTKSNFLNFDQHTSQSFQNSYSHTYNKSNVYILNYLLYMKQTLKRSPPQLCILLIVYQYLTNIYPYLKFPKKTCILQYISSPGIIIFKLEHKLNLFQMHNNVPKA